MSASRNSRGLEQLILKVIKTGVRPVAVGFLDADQRGERIATGLCARAAGKSYRTPDLTEDSG